MGAVKRKNERDPMFFEAEARLRDEDYVDVTTRAAEMSLQKCLGGWMIHRSPVELLTGDARLTAIYGLYT